MAAAKSTDDVLRKQLIATGNWTEVVGAPVLRWVDERLKKIDGGGTQAISTSDAIARQVRYEAMDAEREAIS